MFHSMDRIYVSSRAVALSFDIDEDKRLSRATSLIPIRRIVPALLAQDMELPM